MLFKTILMWIIAAGVVVGGIDYLLGNKLGAGKAFYEGFMLMGKSVLGMVGILCLAPVLGQFFAKIVTPIFALIGADPGMFGSVFAIDMGGYSLAISMAESQQIGLYSGIVIASLFGPTMVYYLPLGFQLLEEKDHVHFAKGILIGLTVLPVGCIVGGFLSGLSFTAILINNIPAFLLCLLLIVGMVISRDKVVRICLFYGRILTVVGILGIVIAFVQYLTGITFLPNMGELSESFVIVGYMTVTIVGFMPLAGLLTKYCGKVLSKIGGKIGLDAVGITGLIMSTASATPVFTIIKDMKPRSKVLVTSFMIYGSMSAHLGFTIGVAPEMVLALVAAKSSAAVAGFMIAFFMTKNMEREVLSNEE